MKKIDLIQKLKQLEGITQDERAYLINLVNTKKKYGLVWEDKTEDVEEQLRENLPVLKEVKEKAIVNGVYPNHILIEGDNLHVLTALTFTHEGEIDVIFIDPPYNTGNKDFKYNDTFVDKNDSYRHSKWLSFVERRLLIAKRLLKDTGFIFISIDDNEQSPLKLLCDEIFGEDLFVANFLWKKKGTSTNVEGVQVSSLTDYVLCYRKSKNAKLTPRITLAESRKYPHEDGEGNYRTTVIEKKNSGGYRRDTMMFKILGQNPRPGKRWQIGETTARTLEKKNRFIIEDETIKQKIYDFEDEDTSSAHPNFLDNHGSSDSAAKMVNDEILGVSEKFNNPKPIELLSFFIDIANLKKDITVLDFFAGSGSTLHAVMKLNAKDNGTRKCIIVTNNENNICDEVTYPRTLKVINGYNYNGKKKEKLYSKNITLNVFKKAEEILEEIELLKDEFSTQWDLLKMEIKDGELMLWGETSNGQEITGLLKNNLRYYTSDFVNRAPSLKNKKELTKLATELLCIKEDVYAEQKIIGEYKLNATYTRCFQQADLYLLVIYDEDVIEQMVALIQQLVQQDAARKLHFKVYVFSNGQYPYTEEFEEVLPYVTLCALPDAIYKAYQNVLPKRQRKAIPELEEQTAEDVENQLDAETIDLFNQR